MVGGRLAEVLRKDFARRYPSACVENFEIAALNLDTAENLDGVVPTEAIRVVRDVLQLDVFVHSEGMPYAAHGGRVGDSKPSG